MPGIANIALTTDYTFRFRIQKALIEGDRVVVTFPDEYSLSETVTTVAMTSNMPADSEIKIVIQNVTNPSTQGV